MSILDITVATYLLPAKPYHLALLIDALVLLLDRSVVRLLLLVAGYCALLAPAVACRFLLSCHRQITVVSRKKKKVDKATINFFNDASKPQSLPVKSAVRPWNCDSKQKIVGGGFSPGSPLVSAPGVRVRVKA